MNREEIKNIIYSYFKQLLPLTDNPTKALETQMGTLYHLFDESSRDLPVWQKTKTYTVIREIVNELINNGMLYPGLAGDQNSSYPWLTITEYGKMAFAQEDWLPYDPEGYINALKTKVPNIDSITLTYIGESIAAFNRRHLLSATITLGVASENIMLNLIEKYLNWIQDAQRKQRLQRKITDKFIYTQYKEFKNEFVIDVTGIPTELQQNWETYLDGVFNFIRLNRNSAGHPTGNIMDVKTVYANLQIFSDYSRYIYKLIENFTR